MTARIKICVTGGAGFIGSSFVLSAIKIGCEVLVLDKLTYAASDNNLSQVWDNSLFKFVQKDICDYESLYVAIAKFKPDFIVNFAAESHVDNSIYDPKVFLDSNIYGTYNILEVLRNLKSKDVNIKFVHVSTDEVYGSLNEEGLFTEKSQYKPNSPYSATKAASDHLVRAWSKTFGVPSVITNCCNNFGPRQHSEKFIPKIIYSLLNNQKMPVYSNGENVREWIFVDDHNAGLFKIIKDFKPDNKFNIGSGVEKTNMQVLKEVYRQLNERNLIFKDFEDTYINVSDRPGHDFRYAIDSTKFKTNMDWYPQTSFEQGISITLDYYIGLV